MTEKQRAMKSCRRSQRYERCVLDVKAKARGTKRRRMQLAAAVCTVSVCGGKVRHPGGQ